MNCVRFFCPRWREGLCFKSCLIIVVCCCVVFRVCYFHSIRVPVRINILCLITACLLYDDSDDGLMTVVRISIFPPNPTDI